MKYSSPVTFHDLSALHIHNGRYQRHLCLILTHGAYCKWTVYYTTSQDIQLTIYISILALLQSRLFLKISHVLEEGLEVLWLTIHRSYCCHWLTHLRLTALLLILLMIYRYDVEMDVEVRLIWWPLNLWKLFRSSKVITHTNIQWLEG